jgi:pimeloyl-ACP methyl ester carboxylesterase
MDRIVYLHGFASGPDSTKARVLRERFSGLGIALETPDLNAGGFEKLTLSGQLALLEGLLQGQPAVLIGSSLGGYLSALYAARHAEVGKVVLLAPAFGFGRIWGAEIGPEKLEQWRRLGWMEVFNYREGRPVRLGYQLMADALQYEDEPDFAQPGLLLHGLDDNVVPIKHSRRFAAGHPNVRLIEKRTDHQMTDIIDDLFAEMRNFLEL